MKTQKNAFTAGAAVPANPCEGCSYRHRDNAPNGYFDEMLEHSREEMRHACRLVPIEQKPCLENVLFGEAAAKIVAQQCLSMVRRSVKSLQREINREAEEGKPWGDAEVELDNVIHLVATGLQALHERPLNSLAEFETAWWRLSQVMNMCCRVHTDKESVLYSFLHGVALELESLPNLWDHVAGAADEGDSYGV